MISSFAHWLLFPFLFSALKGIQYKNSVAYFWLANFSLPSAAKNGEKLVNQTLCNIAQFLSWIPLSFNFFYFPQPFSLLKKELFLIQFTCEYNSLSLKIYTLVNNDYVVVSSQAQMTATVILLPGVLGERLAVLIVLWLFLQLLGQQILPQLATAQ